MCRVSPGIYGDCHSLAERRGGFQHGGISTQNEGRRWDKHAFTDNLSRLVFILYVIMVFVVTLFIVMYVAPRYGRSNILVYISVCSLIGSLSVLSVKVCC